jgi:tRNA-dihydrouridine synthase
MSFWNAIEKPIIALSPMDGVTDASFRFVTAKYGRPDVLFTEFTSVETINAAPEVFARHMAYSETERPIVAQIYGRTPDAFYRAAHVVCELGFDGLDINMGCPARKVASRGCGAGLILNPSLARSIIRAAKSGVRDWASGQNLWDLELNPRLIAQVMDWNRTREAPGASRPRSEIPVSVKTRVGYDRVVIDEWLEHLLEERPAAISIHGRTLKQMYKGVADWNAISRAVTLARNSETLILGNGDLKSMNDVARRTRESGVDGVLLGRSALGNPWIFRNKDHVKLALAENSRGSVESIEDSPVGLDERSRVLMEHAIHFEDHWGSARFVGMRKHLAWYCKGFEGAAKIRARLMRVNNVRDIRTVLNTGL